MIREKYKSKQPEIDTSRLETSDLADREKKIDDFKERIQSLLKTKRMSVLDI